MKKYLVGNKCDMSDEERKISFDEGSKLASGLGVPFFEVSAKTGENINQLFYAIAAELLTEYNRRDSELFPKKKVEKKKDDCVIC